MVVSFIVFILVKKPLLTVYISLTAERIGTKPMPSKSSRENLKKKVEIIFASHRSFMTHSRHGVSPFLSIILTLLVAYAYS